MSQGKNGKVTVEKADTEVVAKAKRRQYTSEYKLRILGEVDACKGKGQIGALLRKEGLYSSVISKWRQQNERGSLGSMAPKKRGPKVDAQAADLAKLQSETERLRERLRRAELIIDVQKKVLCFMLCH